MLLWTAAVLHASSSIAISSPDLRDVMFRKTFPDSQLINCDYQTKIPKQSCQDLTNYLHYATWAAFWYNNSIPPSPSYIFPDLNPKFFTFNRDVFFDRSPVIYNKYGYPDLDSCLLADCGQLIIFKKESAPFWSNVWQNTKLLAACLKTRDMKHDKFGYIADGSLGLIYELALAGRVGDCSPNQFMAESFHMGVRLSAPGGSF